MALAILATNPALAAQTPAEISGVLAPREFSNQEHAEVIIEGIVPASCFAVSTTAIKVEAGIIRVTQYLTLKSEMCLWVEKSFQVNIDLGILKEGRFTIVDGTSQKTIGRILVQNRPTLNQFAPIAEVRSISGTRSVLVNGIRSSGCIELSGLEIGEESDEVIVVHPRAQRNLRLPCTRQATPFTEIIELSERVRLIQVKNVEGRSINLVVNPSTF
jgi:hypothetical protein